LPTPEDEMPLDDLGVTGDIELGVNADIELALTASFSSIRRRAASATSCSSGDMTPVVAVNRFVAALVMKHLFFPPF